MRVLRLIFAFMVAVVLLGLLGAGASSLIVQAAFPAMGVDLTLAERLSMLAFDIRGMGPIYGAVMAPGLILAFLTAGGIAWAMPGLRPFVFALAGAATVLVALFAMTLSFGFVPIGGARTLGGLASQAGAGALAGLAFALLKPARAAIES